MGCWFITWRHTATWAVALSCCGLRCQSQVCMGNITVYQSQKWAKIFTGATYKLFFSFSVISDVYRSFIPNKSTFTKYCLTQWISKHSGRFEIHWVRQYLVNFTGLTGIINTTVYKPIFTDLENVGKISAILFRLQYINWQSFEHTHQTIFLSCFNSSRPSDAYMRQ